MVIGVKENLILVYRKENGAEVIMRLKRPDRCLGVELALKDEEGKKVEGGSVVSIGHLMAAVSTLPQFHTTVGGMDMEMSGRSLIRFKANSVIVEAPLDVIDTSLKMLELAISSLIPSV